jgi:Uma2 family endonuclease
MDDLELPLKIPFELLPAHFRLARVLTDEELQRFCEGQEALHVEREPDGSFTVRSLWGSSASLVSMEVKMQLYQWAERTNLGRVLGLCGFYLPDDSMRGPLIAFVSKHKWDSLGSSDCFLPFCPEVVIEVASINYSHDELEERMRMWISNGCEHAWLIDPERRSVEIHRPNTEPELHEQPTAIYGEDSFAGFVLDVPRIWI